MGEQIYYISPQPTDVTPLMNDLLELYQQLLNSKVDAVVVASVISFYFVYIHPFDDGNGRLHRWIIHHILSKMGFYPEKLYLSSISSHAGKK